MTRNLKIEPQTPYVPPQIRLKGKWLEKAGFPSGMRVTATLLQPGHLEIKLSPQPQQ